MADPERLGKYEIKGALGKGAMGTVYKGFDPHIERYVAIKTIRKDLVEPELAAQYMARFKNEAKAAGRLHHPNIVGVYEYGEDDDVTFIAMEYVEGAGLREYLNRRVTFDFAQLVALMDQLLNALEFAHARGVVHRDIKPSNLIVTNQGVLKVADFGIARVDRTDLTMAGMLIGTPLYMSPEQCRGLDVDARSDLFSAGVVLYELLTGEKPFRGNMERSPTRSATRSRSLRRGCRSSRLPAAVDQLIATALAKEPAARFQRCACLPRLAARRGAAVGGGRGRRRHDDGGDRHADAAKARAGVGRGDAAHRRARARARTRADGEGDRASGGGAGDRSRGALLDPVRQHHRSRHAPRIRRGVRAHRPAAACARALRRARHHGRHVAPAHRRARERCRRLACRHRSTQGAPLEPEFIDQSHRAARGVHRADRARSSRGRRRARRGAAREFLRRVADNLGTQERASFLHEVGFGGS